MRETVDVLFAEVRSALRFRWHAVAVAWGVCLLGWLVVYLLPGRYDTTARVYVDTNTLLRPLLEGLAVNPNNINEVDMLRRALLSTPQLQRVISESPLKSKVRSDAEMQSLVADLATRIRITGDTQSRLYTIAFGDNDPAVSFAVVKSLLGRFVGESIESKRADADSAQKFLGAQIREVEQRLTESEAALAAFKRKNVGFMPDDRGGYFERLQGEMREVDRLEATMAVALNKRAELRGKLLGNGTGSGSGGGSSSAVLTTSMDGRLAEARSRLDDMLLRYTENHPDVIALQDAINSMEQQRKAEMEILRTSGGALGAPRAGQTNVVLQNLQIALNEVELEIASTQSQLADHRKRSGALRGNMNVLPEVEAELARLTRDYGINRTQYESLLQRLASARLTDRADRSDDLKFRIIEPPALPLAPASPKRGLLVIGVLIAGLGAGGAMAWLLAMLRPVYSSLTQLRLLIGDRLVLGSLSNLGAGADGSQQSDWRQRTLPLAAALGGLVVVGGVMFALQSKAEVFRHAIKSLVT